MGGGGGKGGKKGAVQVNQYRMSLHYGVCVEIDVFCGLYAQNKTVWEGEMNTNGMVAINQPTLWSSGQWDVTAQSAASSGGPVGNMYIMLGASDQVVPAPFASRLGLTQDTCPGFRGLFSLFFCGQNDTDGFIWANNMPDVPGVQARMFRMPKTPLDQTYVQIPAQGFAANRPVADGWNDDRYDPNGVALPTGGGTTYGPTIPDANPAHIIYEILTDVDFGMGVDGSLIDTDSFNTAAGRLFDEQLGMSIRWSERQTIEALTSEILNTIQGSLFVDPNTGLFRLKLFRADYDVTTLPIIDNTNCRITSFTRKMLGETANTVSVEWTNPLTESTETVMAFDPAGVSLQGGNIVQTNSYPGVRNEILALQLAMRDLASVSAPLAVIELECDRSFWDLAPGEVVKINYPEYGLTNLVCRIGKVDYGKPADAKIMLNLTEDIFAITANSYQAVSTTQWTGGDTTISPITNAVVMPIPYFLAAQQSDGGTAKGREYPEQTVAVLAQQPASNTSVYQLWSDTTDSLGAVTLSEVGAQDYVAYALTGANLNQEITTSNFAVNAPVAYLYYLLIGNDPATQEIAIVSALVSGTTVNLHRGMLDTTPKAWPAGTPMWVVNPALSIVEGSGHPAGSPVTFKCCPMVQGRVLKPTSAADTTGTPDARQFLPTRPAGVTVAGDGGTVAFGDYTQTTTADITATWATRNRVTEDYQLLFWDGASITPESGQTTTIELWTEGMGTMIWSLAGLTGTTGTVPYTAFEGRPIGVIRVIAVLGGLESLQGHTITAHVPPSGGYGKIYGYDYGGV